MHGKGPFRTGVAGRMSGLARQLVVLALISAALAASFAASAPAADWVRESNMAARPMEWVDSARDLTHRSLGAAAVLVHRSVTYFRPYLLNWSDLWVGSDGRVWVINTRLWRLCSAYGCCSSTWYGPTYQGLYFQVCMYEGRGYFTWRRP